jgi:hypothetical protein
MPCVHCVVGLGERVERHRQRQRIIDADERNEAIAPHSLGPQVRRPGENGRYGEVEFSGRELVVQPVAFDRLKMQVETRRVAAQSRHQGGQKGRLVEVDRRDPHDTRSLSRFERRGRFEGAGDIGQSAVNGPRKLERSRRRLHASVA